MFSSELHFTTSLWWWCEQTTCKSKYLQASRSRSSRGSIENQQIADPILLMTLRSSSQGIKKYGKKRKHTHFAENMVIISSLPGHQHENRKQTQNWDIQTTAKTRVLKFGKLHNQKVLEYKLSCLHVVLHVYCHQQFTIIFYNVIFTYFCLFKAFLYCFILIQARGNDNNVWI